MSQVVQGDAEWCLQDGEARVDSQQEEIKEEQSDPVFSTLESSKDDGPSSKNKGESSVWDFVDVHTLAVGQVSHCSENGKATQEGEHAIGNTDDSRVCKSWFSPGAMATICRHGSESDTEREEDLVISEGQW